MHTPTPSTCRILWIRHGETAWNTEKRFQGHLDIPLNATGHAQAARLAESFRQRVPFTALYASDLSRASATADYLAKVSGLELRLLPGLRERNYGDLAGLTSDEMAKRFPPIYAGLARRDPDAELPGGESLRTFFDRIIHNTQRLVNQHPGQTLCVVVHGGVLDCIYRQAMGIELSKPRQWLLANASLNIVDHTTGGWRVHAWGDTAHLEKAAADEVDGRVV